ncbi:GNAT family N-acetyltransferase [Weissella bombi]|uniref:Predicted N-acyltransferase, GNAT family n=1 Tax=Weissella bombi TaxID=1505725 RepID=A0A1C3ZHF5_9LACO|nr:GNAT family N-acetyltransferase [Weissella bombi]SCB81781.1 Predicted N-acyltransferase, GNAT family [Weissella bombi]
MNKENFTIQHAYGISEISKAAIAIRTQVFMIEQNVPKSVELDNLDDQTIHYVGFLDSKPITTARIAENNEHTNWHIQRVATIMEARGNGYAGQLLKQIIADAKQANIHSLDLGAQVQAIGFYKKIGFTAEGPVFQEANIDHRHMILELTSSNTN